MSSSYLPLTGPLYQYMLAQRTDAHDAVLNALRIETQKLGEVSEMAVSPDECSLLSMLVALLGTKYAVEVGTFTGSSSISIARSIPPGGKLLCFDQDFRYTSIARRYWFKAGLQDRIELRLGKAREMLSHFRPPAPLDFVFIDADKEGYDFYYEALLPHVRPNGLIVFDNMFSKGQVIDPVARTSPAVRAIDNLNRKLSRDPRVHCLMLPVADGITLCRKLERAY